MPDLQLPNSSLISVTSAPATAEDVVAQLRKQGKTVATAESLTAGLLSATIATVPGASNVLRGGLVVYATDLKASLAGVSADFLRRHGPVHPEVAAALATGAARSCKADFGVGLTGVAGPDPQDGHAVGEVYVGVGTKNPEQTVVAALPAGWWDADARDVRASIREAAVALALTLLSTVDFELA